MSGSSREMVLKEPELTVGTVSNVAKPIPVKKALEEEDFTEAMKKIIRRDYFPDVQKLEAQLAYIEATESNDPVKLREISERYATDLIQTPTATPLSWARDNNRAQSSGDTSEEHPPPVKVHKPEDSKSLDAFLHKYHSEDDASFGEIMEREEAKRREKFAWMYERESLADRMSRPAITSGREDTQRLESGGNTLAITGGTDNETQHGEIKLWKYTSKNALMYVPDGIEYSPAELLKRGKGREIKKSNTRLSRAFLNTMATAGSVSDAECVQERQKQLQKEKIGIDGKQLGVSESPKVQGYGFVATPQIHPGVDASPLMTWGTIEGTPLHIDTDVTATPGQVFKIPKASIRDGIGLRLASKASKSQREKKKVAMAQATSAILGSPSIRSPIGSTSDKLRLLSPAARRLIRHSTTPGTLKGDRALRASYSTPTRSNVSTPNRTPGGGYTPTSYQQGGRTPGTPSITDNLLKLK